MRVPELPFSHPITRKAADLGSTCTYGSGNYLIFCEDDRARLWLQLQLISWVEISGKYCHAHGNEYTLPKGKIVFVKSSDEIPSGSFTVQVLDFKL